MCVNKRENSETEAVALVECNESEKSYPQYPPHSRSLV